MLRIAPGAGIKLQRAASQPGQPDSGRSSQPKINPRSHREVEWSENIYFWEGEFSVAAAHAVPSHQDQAFLGVDLEKAPGDYELSVSATTENGEQAECTAPWR